MFFKNPHVMCSSIVTKVCDHRNYCKNDKNALYIGQVGHIAYPPHRRINNWFPEGFADIRGLWNNLCSYTNNAKGNYALCNVPSNTHAWRSPAQYNPGFMCGAAKPCQPVVDGSLCAAAATKLRVGLRQKPSLRGLVRGCYGEPSHLLWIQKSSAKYTRYSHVNHVCSEPGDDSCYCCLVLPPSPPLSCFRLQISCIG